MKLKIDGERRQLIPIQNFRVQHKLPHEFGVNYFEPKNWAGLGSIDGVGSQMMSLKEQVFLAAPAVLLVDDLLTTVEALTLTFHHALVDINQKIGLRPSEIDFAASGFHDLLQAAAYQMMQLVCTATGADMAQNFDFDEVYRNWLDDSTRVSTNEHRYTHHAEEWRVRVVNDVYGRIGLMIVAPTETHYLQDVSLACPAAEFMYDLCHDLSHALRAALVAA